MNVLLKSAAIGALMSGMATAAAAQITFDGAMTLGYAWGDAKGALSGGPDIDGFTMDMGGTFSFGGPVDLGVSLSLAMPDIEDAGTDVILSNFSLTPTYDFGSGLYAGVYVEHSLLELDYGDASLTSYGVIGGYAAGPYDVSGYIGQSETDPDLASGADVTDWGVSGTYLASSDLMVGGGIARSRLDVSGTEYDLDMLKVGAAYAYNEFTFFSGAAIGSVETVDVNLIGLGVAYDLTSTINFPLSASLEYNSSELDMMGTDGGYDVWKFGITLPMGNKSGPVVPQNSIAAGAFDPRANTLVDAIDTAF
ncbi:hypothetical protein KUV28_05935 [Ferrimonas balearica]|nr:hypothetical protein [Ferrimonas balearica]